MDLPANLTTEVAAVRSRESGALIDESKPGLRKRVSTRKEGTHPKVDTYAETFCGCFTALRKRAAFAAASSRLVAAVEALDFFGRLPKRPEAARRFCARPPAAGAMDEPAP